MMMTGGLCAHFPRQPSTCASIRHAAHIAHSTHSHCDLHQLPPTQPNRPRFLGKQHVPEPGDDERGSPAVELGADASVVLADRDGRCLFVLFPSPPDALRRPAPNPMDAGDPCPLAYIICIGGYGCPKPYGTELGMPRPLDDAGYTPTAPFGNGNGPSIAGWGVRNEHNVGLLCFDL